MPDIRMYGADWCGDCRRSKRLLDELGVGYEWIDVEADPGARTRMREINGGRNVIPTIVLPDGSFLTEPSNEELARTLQTAGLRG